MGHMCTGLHFEMVGYHDVELSQNCAVVVYVVLGGSPYRMLVKCILAFCMRKGQVFPCLSFDGCK